MYIFSKAIEVDPETGKTVIIEQHPGGPVTRRAPRVGEVVTVHVIEVGKVFEKHMFDFEADPDLYELKKSVLVATRTDSLGEHTIRSYGGTLIRITVAHTTEQQIELVKHEGFAHAQEIVEEWEERFFDRRPNSFWRGELPF